MCTFKNHTGPGDWKILIIETLHEKNEKKKETENNNET